MAGFCEQVVKVKRGVKQFALSALVLILFLLPVVFFMMLFYVSGEIFMAVVAMVCAMAGVGLCCIIIPKILTVELDYSVLGNYFAVDKVVAKAKRKKKLRVEIKNFEKLEKLSDSTKLAKKYAKRYDFTGGAELDKVYFAEFRITDVGLCMMLFCPNQKILDGMRPMLRHEIIRELFYKK